MLNPGRPTRRVDNIGAPIPDLLEDDEVPVVPVQDCRHREGVHVGRSKPHRPCRKFDGVGDLHEGFQGGSSRGWRKALTQCSERHLYSVKGGDHREASQAAFKGVRLRLHCHSPAGPDAQVQRRRHLCSTARTGSNSHANSDRFCVAILAVSVMPGFSPCALPNALIVCRPSAAVTR